MEIQVYFLLCFCFKLQNNNKKTWKELFLSVSTRVLNLSLMTCQCEYTYISANLKQLRDAASFDKQNACQRSTSLILFIFT